MIQNRDEWGKILKVHTKFYIVPMHLGGTLLISNVNTIIVILEGKTFYNIHFILNVNKVFFFKMWSLC